MFKILTIIIILLINNSIASENIYWSNVKDGPKNIEEAKEKYFDDRTKLDPIEGIWFADSDSTTTVIFKEDGVYKEYIISIGPEDSKIFERTWEGTYIKISVNNYSFFNRVWYLRNGKIDKLRTQSGIAEILANRFLDKDYFELSESGRQMDYAKTKVWPLSENLTNENIKPKDKNDDKSIKTSGTGFFINTKGDIITNSHVVNECSKINIRNSIVDSQASVNASDENLDLALLSSNSNNKYFLDISNKKINKLQKIIAAGFPFGEFLSSDLKFTSGIISSLKGFDNNSSQLQIDAALNPGNSGGPILDQQTGEVVGVAVAVLRKDVSEGINFAIKGNALKLFLESNEITYNNTNENKLDILENIEASTVNITCH